MKYTLLLCSFLLSTVLFAQELQEKHQKAKISYTAANSLESLESLGLAVDHGVHKKGHFVISDFSVTELEEARAAGFQVEILVEDSKAYFLQQNRNPTEAFRNPSCDASSGDYETPANFNLGSMGGYLTYQEVLDEFAQMQNLYPNLITPATNISDASGDFLTEGQPDNSVTPSIGNNGIKWLKISDNPTVDEGEAQILYTSIHHAREPASLMQLLFYMWYLLENYATDPEVKSIVDNSELYFVPVVNPDGYLYNQVTDPNGGGFWRKNRKNGNGTDNNRNYDYFIDGNPGNGSWGGPGSSTNPSSQTYHGTGPLSEVENQAIKRFVEDHEFVMAFNNHTSGQLLYYPFGYANVATQDDALFQAVSGELTSRNGYTALRDSPFSGDSDDFMYGTVGTHNKIFAFTPEIGTSFWPSQNQIIPIAKNMMYLNITSAKMINNFASVTSTGAFFVGDEAEQIATFDIRRLGIAGSGTFTVNVNPVSSNFAFVGGGATLTLDLLETDNESINYVVASGTESGDDIVYELVVNNGDYDTKVLVTKKFGALAPVFEDAGDSTTNNFTNNGWGTTGTTFVSPSSSITDSPNDTYQNDENKTIALSNPIDLTAASGAGLSFFAKWEIEDSWDYAQVEISTNNGGSWEPQCGIYTNAGSNNGFQPEGEPLYDGVQNDWVLEEIDLSDYLGESILVRFQFASDGLERRDGFYFDDLTISVVEETVLNIEGTAIDTFTLFPNPVQDILNIKTIVNNYVVELFNVQGQLVYISKNNSGNTAVNYSNFADGIYLMRLTSRDATQTVKIVKQ
jgi:carboxypeptidase T